MSSGLLYAIVGALIDAAITAMTGAYKAWEARNVVFSRFQNCNYRFAAHYREGYEGAESILSPVAKSRK